MHRFCSALLILGIVSGPAWAQETQTYVYDAKGRVTKVIRTGNVNNGVTSTYTLDKANNRRRIVTTGSPS